MARVSARRPLPAAAFLLALVVLTSIVWFRVLHRTDPATATAVGTSCAVTAATVVPQPGSVTVHVLNTTTRTGLAAAVQHALAVLGFKAPDVNNDTPAVTGVAEIRFGSPARAAATLVSYYFPGSTLKLDSTVGGDVTVALGAKYTALATTAAVKVALKKAGINQSVPSGGKLAVTPSPTPTPTC